VTTAPDVSIVIPAYNSGSCLGELVGRVVDVLQRRGLTHELILVNDASEDDTWTVIEKLAVDLPTVRGIDLLANHGQPLATMCGLAAAQGKLVATMDDDLEHLPEELPKLLEALDEHPDWDAVIGRWDRDGASVRGIGSWLHATADRLAWGTPKGFRHTAFRVMRRPVADALVAHRTASPVVGPMLYRTASSVHNVDVRHGTREHGRSGFTFADGVRRVVRNFTQGSTLPLQVLSGIGILVATASVLVAAVVAVRWLIGARGPEGWLSVFMATLFLGGLILLAFGVLGQYIATIVDEVRGAPRWSVRRETGLGESGDT
jgi:glycosyltransferase involved in cell wall biosynthesis